MPPQANTEALPSAQDPFGQVVETLKGANNILITVSANPSIDQLSACIGLTLALNKLGKHATAVFSGEVPPAIKFLQPEKTIEANTDSLRDFIIALDKAKADKLRYKVEDQVVKIFITPYKTSISKKDLEFSQGDFNVDAVVALGVHQKTDLDTAITSHGRILHDATVVSINTNAQSKLGSIDWTHPGASSLCEMTADVIGEFGKDMFDTQISTALLTGVVVETDRFSNDKASPNTMSVAGMLMSAGASTQLVSSKLEEAETAKEVKVTKKPVQTVSPAEKTEPKPDEHEPSADGTIQIAHEDKPKDETIVPKQEPPKEAPQDKIASDDHDTAQSAREYLTIPVEGQKTKKHKEVKPTEPQLEELKLDQLEKPSSQASSQLLAGSNRIMEPPQFGGQLTANDVPEYKLEEPGNDTASKAPHSQAILTRDNATSVSSHPAKPDPVPAAVADDIPATTSLPPVAAPPPAKDDASVASDDDLDALLAPKNDDETLTDIEKAVEAIGW